MGRQTAFDVLEAASEGITVYVYSGMQYYLMICTDRLIMRESVGMILVV